MLGMGLLALTFAVGMLAGAASSRVLNAGEPDARALAAACAPQRGPHYMFDELDLRPEQRTRIEAIMARRRAGMDSVWREHGAPIRAAYDSTRMEIRTVLTPAQRVQYDELRARREREHLARDANAAAK
jgi:Spy/CpxP family protein refolding chaperone